MDTPDSVIVLGEPIIGTSLIRRFRAAGTLRVETAPRYLPPIPRPAHAWADAMSEAARAGYSQVVLDGQVLTIATDKPRGPGLRLVRDDPRPGVLRRIGQVIGVVKERA